MPVTFQGGQALPQVGSAAYTQAQQGTGAGSYNSSTGSLNINGNPAGQSSIPAPIANGSALANSSTPQNITAGGNNQIATPPPITPQSLPTTSSQNAQQQTTPSVGEPGSLLQSSSSQLSPEQIGQKYVQGFTSSQALSSTPTPQTASEGRAMVSAQTQSYAPPQPAYQPSQTFMQVGDPIMKSFISSAMQFQQDAIDTGYTAKRLQQSFANQVQNIDLQAANIQNIMNGTRDDIRAEIGKAGGFTTESQVEGLVTTRNRDLLKQYNNIELQKQTMQSQMQLQVGLAQADHQFAVDKFNNVMQTANMYKGIYTNATDQVDKLVQNVGYKGIAAAYNNDPFALAMVEQHLNMPQGTLSDPAKLQALDTYRQQSLAMSQQRLNQSGQRLEIYVGNNTPNQQAINGQLQSYKTTGVVPPLKNATQQANAFWTAANSDPDLIGDAAANKNLRTAASSALKNQTTQYEATKTAIGTVDKQLDLLSSYINGDPSKGLQAVDRSGVPLINRYKNFLAGSYTGDKDVTALNNIIQTASTEFAKILGGSAASISGTPVSTQHDAQNLLNSSMNTGQLNTVINLMKQEGQFRINSQKETIDSITSGLKSIGNSSSSQPSTQVMTGPDGKTKYNVPQDKVDLFKQNGYK